MTVSEDGSGDLRIEIFPPPEIADSAEAAVVERLVRDALDGVEGGDFEVDQRLGQDFYRVEIPFEDFRQLTTNLADGTTMAGQRLAPFSQFDLRELPDGGWSLNAVTNPLAQAATFEEGSALAGLQQLAGTDEAGAGLELSITLPGTLTDSDADSQENNTARWQLSDPAASYTLQMRTEPSPLLTPLQWVLVGLLALFGLGGVLMFVSGTGPVKRKSLIKPSRKEHEAFLPPTTREKPDKKASKQPRVRRRKKLTASQHSGWENPAPSRSAEGQQTAGEGGGGPEPHRPLPPLQADPPAAAPGDSEQAPSHVERQRPPSVLPPGPGHDDTQGGERT